MSYAGTIDQVKELDKFSDYAKKAIVEAFELAKLEGVQSVDPTHLFIGILRNKKNIASRLLNKMGVDLDRTIESLFPDIPEGIEKSSNLKLTEKAKEILVQSFVVASELKHVYVGTEHILLSLLKQKELDFVKDLAKVDLDYKAVLSGLMSFATYHQGVFSKEIGQDIDSQSDEQESSLSLFAQDMNMLAEEGRFMPVYGRDDEVERVIHILSRKTKSNPILVGEAGVGKTAIIEGLVQKIVNQDVPLSFGNKIIVNLDLAGILAGSKIRGDVEERIIAIMKEASQNPDIILFIDEIHMIIGAGSAGQGSMDIANILKPYLTSDNVSLIGATTLNEYRKYFEADTALTRRFQPVIIDEIKPDEAIQVLHNIKHKLEKYHDVSITEEGIEEAVRLSHRYITDRYLPDKAIDILDEACAGIKISKEKGSNKFTEYRKQYEKIRQEKEKALENNKMKIAAKLRIEEINLEEKLKKLSKSRKKKGREKSIVGGDEIRRVVSKFTKIPVERMDSSTVKSLISFEKILEKSVIGQPDAVTKVSSAIRRAKVGIGDQFRPMASFLFLGPTGVGKTELAKTIAKELFGDEDALIQIDMSEFMEQHSVSKLIGSPPGYVGFQEGGQLTEKVRRNPYTVVLFDEIEKAHPDLLNILLQVLEEGQLQDSQGHKVNFKNTIIIMTSNIGAEEVMNDKVLGFSLDFDSDNDIDEKSSKVDEAFDEVRTQLLEELKETLRPELLNRIDDILIFRGLGDSDVLKIAKLEIEKLNKRIKEKNVQVAVSKGAIEFIAEKGASKEYGARNIKRKVQEYIENPLAELILEKNLIKSEETNIIKINKNKDNIELSLD